MKRFLGYLLAFVIVVLVVRSCVCREDPPPPPIRIATFNIEDFPKNKRQIAGAFDEIGELAAPIVAVEEIMDPKRFTNEATSRLGKRWKVTFEPFVEIGYRHNGVLYDSKQFSFVSTTTYDETRLGGDHKRVLEVRLKPDSGTIVRVLVVHLKCCGDGREIRARQYAALTNIVRGAVASGERVVVLGDFNATDDGDRADLARLASATGLHWRTEPLACSAFWKTREDDCPRSRLDHVLGWSTGGATAYGACATEGCGTTNSCPRYVSEVSDHCPVVAEFN